MTPWMKGLHELTIFLNVFCFYLTLTGLVKIALRHWCINSCLFFSWVYISDNIKLLHSSPPSYPFLSCIVHCWTVTVWSPTNAKSQGFNPACCSTLLFCHILILSLISSLTRQPTAELLTVWYEIIQPQLHQTLSHKCHLLLPPVSTNMRHNKVKEQSYKY